MCVAVLNEVERALRLEQVGRIMNVEAENRNVYHLRINVYMSVDAGKTAVSPIGCNEIVSPPYIGNSQQPLSLLVLFVAICSRRPPRCFFIPVRVLRAL